MLASRESLDITAPVSATVVSFNHSKTNDSGFEAFCESAVESSGAYTYQFMMNDRSIELLDYPSPRDQSLQYIGITPDPGLDYPLPCSNFPQYAKPYDVNRQLCEDIWSITRGSIQLVNGSCNGTILLPEQQLVTTNNTPFLGI